MAGVISDHFAGVPGYDGRAEDAIGSFLDVYLHEADLLAIGDRPVTSCIGMVKVFTGRFCSLACRT